MNYSYPASHYEFRWTEASRTGGISPPSGDGWYLIDFSTSGNYGGRYCLWAREKIQGAVAK